MFTDGQTVKSMPPSQDHKRLLEGNEGPNTGGMGAYAPCNLVSSPMCGGIIRLFKYEVVFLRPRTE